MTRNASTKAGKTSRPRAEPLPKRAKTVERAGSAGWPEGPEGPERPGRPGHPDLAPRPAPADPAATDIERADERKAGSIEQAAEPDPADAVTGFLETRERDEGPAGP